MLALMDTGSEVNLISAEVMTNNPGWAKYRRTCNVKLNFGNASKGVATDCMENVPIEKLGRTCYGEFVISPDSIPGCDVILGMPFMKGNKVNLGFNPDSHCVFPDGEIWWDVKRSSKAQQTTYGAEEANISFVGARAARRFIQTRGKNEFQVYQLTIGEIKNIIEASKDNPAQWQEKSVCIDQRIPDLADTYKQSLFRDRVPFPRKEPTGEMPNELMRIPVIEGAIPVKVRAFPMSHGEINILQQLLADLIEKGYVEPADPMSQWCAPVMILRKSGNREGITNQYRLVTDFRRLNALTKSSTYVPPLIRTIIKQLSSAKIFSASDVVGGFYQQTLAEEDRDKTTFVCHTTKGERKFRFRVSCLGLAGAPAAYQSNGLGLHIQQSEYSVCIIR